MGKKLLMVSFAVAAAAVVSSSSMALAPMGPPTAGLKQGQFGDSVEYSYSNADFKLDWGGGHTETAKDVIANMIFVNLGYGITDDFEGFVRLGTANVKGQYDDYSGSGDYRFACGFGTKVTFLKQESINWGVLFQICWLKSEFSQSGSELIPDDGVDTWTDKVELSAYDIEIAFGPAWKVIENLSVYGGPFFDFVNGEVDIDEVGDYGGVAYNNGWSADFEQKSEFGGYVGAQWDFNQNASLFGEFQFTGNGWTYGTGFGWKF